MLSWSDAKTVRVKRGNLFYFKDPLCKVCGLFFKLQPKNVMKEVSISGLTSGLCGKRGHLQKNDYRRFR